MTGRAVCAWCSLDLGERPGLEDGHTTHGICPACRDRLERDLQTLEVAAVLEGRRVLGVELDPTYQRQALERLNRSEETQR